MIAEESLQVKETYLTDVFCRSDGAVKWGDRDWSYGRLDKQGYLIYRFGRNLSIPVAKLIARAFHPLPGPRHARLNIFYHDPCVLHLNGDRTDNRAENLRWATHAEVSRYTQTRKKAKSQGSADLWLSIHGDLRPLIFSDGCQRWVTPEEYQDLKDLDPSERIP